MTLTAAAIAALAAAHTPRAHAADSWTISIGVRETGSSGPVGSNGGTSGDIEWVTSASPTITTADGWKQFTWNFGSDLVSAFTGNGVLSAANNKGVLEHIRIVNSGGNSGAELRLRIDDVVNTVAGTPTTITNFDNVGWNNDQYLFREPIFSNSTINNISTGANTTIPSTLTAHSGPQSMAARWTFVPNGSTTQWLRLTTNNATTLPNPVIDISPGSSLSIWMNMQTYQPTGNRVRGIDASQFQGTGHDWVRAAAPMSAGGGGLSFAFLRATRGGTSGTSSTGSNRVDDPTYVANITGAKAAGLLTGPYHFGRPDLWTPNDAVGLGNGPNTVGTPEDEARHYLQVAGNVMKPGYMRPVYDLEDGNEELNNAQLTNFVLRFNDTLKKYKGPAAQIIVYAGTAYANAVNEPLSQFPLWMPRFQVESDWAAGDVFPNESSYGVWGDSDPLTNLRPWNFWQYYSPDVYIPGINAGTHNDIDVANGDINYVRQFMVQGAIWDGSAGNTWANAANWSTNVAPTASTEVLFDVGGSPTTIVVSAGRQASGIYFADSYTLAGGSLSLSDGRIDVDPGETATIATSLSAPNGFRKVGTGTLTHGAGGGAAAGTSTVTGVAQVLQGTMNVSGGSIAVGGDLMVNPELTQFDKSLIEPFPVDASEITSSTLNISGGAMTAFAAYVGGTNTASGAIGTLNVSSGSLAVTGPLKIWNSAVPMVDSKVNLSGGTLSVGSLDTDGDTASFNWTGGTFAITGAGGLSIATGGPIGPSLTVGTGKQLIVFNALTVGDASTVTLQNGGIMTVGSLDVGGAQNRFSFTGGTFTINGPGTTDLGTRTIGVGAAPMFFNINGGSVINGTLTVGALSNGTVNHSGGTHTVTTLNVGVGAVTTGTHNVSGSAILNATGSLNVGGTGGTAGGSGILNISGGTTTTPTLKIWDTGAAVPGGTRVNLTGGTLNVGSIDTSGNPARFNFTGGTLNHNGPGTSDLGGTTVGPIGALKIFGGTVGGASLTIDPGGLVQVHPDGTLAALQTTNNGLFVLNGGTVTGPWLNNSVGVAQVTSSDPSDFASFVDNAGTIDVQSGASVAFSAGVAGPGAINIAAGASATTPVVASGELNVDGTMTVAPGWPQASIAGLISVNGRLDLKDNKLIVLAGGGEVGTFDGTSYSGLTGRIASAYNFSSWDGPGIATSMFDAGPERGITTLAIATADEVFYAGGTFGGVSVNSGDVLLMYTYAGDLNMDGRVDGSDYGTIDNFVQFPGTSGYGNGDFNYDGIIDGSDYGVIDNTAQLQGDPFPSGTYPALAGAHATLVPEPGGLAALLALAIAPRRERRRRCRLSHP